MQKYANEKTKEQVENQLNEQPAPAAEPEKLKLLGISIPEETVSQAAQKLGGFLETSEAQLKAFGANQQLAYRQGQAMLDILTEIRSGIADLVEMQKKRADLLADVTQKVSDNGKD